MSENKKWKTPCWICYNNLPKDWKNEIHHPQLRQLGVALRMKLSDEKLPSVATHAAGNTHKIPRVRKVSSDSQPRRSHNVLNHCPKDPNCEVFKKTKTTRAKCRIRPKQRVDGIALSTKFGDLITANHKILKVENESRRGHKKRSNRARCIHELDSELSDENKRYIGNNVVFTKDSSAIKEAGNTGSSKALAPQGTCATRS